MLRLWSTSTRHPASWSICTHLTAGPIGIVLGGVHDRQNSRPQQGYAAATEPVFYSGRHRSDPRRDEPDDRQGGSAETPITHANGLRHCVLGRGGPFCRGYGALAGGMDTVNIVRGGPVDGTCLGQMNRHGPGDEDRSTGCWARPRSRGALLPSCPSTS